MTYRVLAIFVLSLGFTVAADQIRSESIKVSIAKEVQKVTDQWVSEDENVGSIWVNSYEDDQKSYSFEVREWKSKTHMVVETSFLCGSEYDESEFAGSCKVDVLRDETTQSWVPIIENINQCHCDVEDF